MERNVGIQQTGWRYLQVIGEWGIYFFFLKEFADRLSISGVDWREGKKHLTVYGKPISLVWDVCASRNGIITGWGYLLTTFEGDL